MTTGKMTIENNLVGFTCGTFDLLHAGHVLMLEEIASQVGTLIVGLQTDPTIDRPEKNCPVQTIQERYTQLSAVKYVSDVFIYTTEEELVSLLQLMKKTHGDRLVRFLGADWKDKEFTGANLGIKCEFNSRDHSYSSSDLRDRVIQAEQVNHIHAFRGDIVKKDERYTLIDNNSMDNLVLSKTILNPLQETRGHRHDGLDEVYHFTAGKGQLLIDKAVYNVEAGSLFAIRGGQFHKVINLSTKQTLEFVCVFQRYERT